jgi:hypothetical protein
MDPLTLVVVVDIVTGAYPLEQAVDAARDMAILRQEGLAMVENLLNMVYEKCFWDDGGWVILLLVYCSRKSRQELCVQSNRLFAMDVMWVGAPDAARDMVIVRQEGLAMVEIEFTISDKKILSLEKVK